MTATLQAVTHPSWCSQQHCVGDHYPTRPHESEPIEVGNLKLAVSQPAMTKRDEYANVVLTIEAATQIDESGRPIPEEELPMISMRLRDVPDFARALLDLYCQR